MPSSFDLQQMIISAAQRAGVPANLALGIAAHESNFTPNAVGNNTNGTSDYGLFQLNTSVLQTFGLSPSQALDPQTNIDTGVNLLAGYLKQYGGDVAKALWAYSDGPGSVASGRQSSGLAQFISFVTGYGGGSSSPDPTPGPEPTRSTPGLMLRILLSLCLRLAWAWSRFSRFFLLTAISAAIAAAQQQMPQEIDFVAPAPAAVSGVSTNVTGTRAGVRYAYWVIANYAGGSAAPALAIEPNAPAFLSGSSFVTISWTAAPSATSYDVLRTNGDTFPPSPCVCAVATAVSGTSTTDTGSVLTSYVFTPKPPARGYIRLLNTGATPAFDASPGLGGGGGVNPPPSSVCDNSGVGQAGMVCMYGGTIPTGTLAAVGVLWPDASNIPHFVSNATDTYLLQVNSLPAAGFARFPGGSNKPTSSELSGDCSTSGSNVITCTKIPPGVTLTGTPSAGQVPTATSPTTATWQTPSGGSTYAASQGPQSAVTMTGSDVAVYSFSNVPALAADACYAIDFVIKAGSAGATTYKLYADSTAIASITSVGATAWRHARLLYCNNHAVQNAQTISMGYEGYCVDGTCATGITGWTQDYPLGLSPTITNNVDWSSSHTLSLRGNAASGTVNPLSMRLGL